MSRRHTTRDRQHDQATRICECSRPLTQDRYLCPTCVDQLADDLADLLDTPRIDRPIPTGSRHLVLAGATYGDQHGDDGHDGALRAAGVRLEPVVSWCPWPRPLEVDPGLWSQLASVLVPSGSERGIDYRAWGGGSGGSDATGLVLNEAASRARRRLAAVLRSLVVTCRAARIEHAGPADTPAGPRTAEHLVPDMARWLLWRVDGLARHPDGAGAARLVHDAVLAARRAVAPPAVGQNLGSCLVDDCAGRYRRPEGSPIAVCDVCAGWIEGRQLIDWQVDQWLDDLCPRGLVVDRLTLLLLHSENPMTLRDQVRKRVDQWVTRDRLLPAVPDADDVVPIVDTVTRGRLDAPVPPRCPWPLYRFADAYALLLDHERTTTEENR